MKKEKNRIVYGKFLIEHDPGEPNPYVVWDIRRVFYSEEQGFNCRTIAEATELVKAINALESKAA